MNIRLDFIAKFKDEDEAVNQMKETRNQFIELDLKLKSLVYLNPNTITPNEALLRSVSLARTNLEQALQYAIKSLCLLHEAE